MKSQDIVVLLKLVCLDGMRKSSSLNSNSDGYSARALEASLGISKTEINASINRSLKIGMVARDRHDRHLKPNKKSLYDFIVHGLKYVFPVKPAELTRGMPTAFSAPVLKNSLSSGGDTLFVWPDAESSSRGQSIKPLFKSVPQAAKEDSMLYDYLALVDAVRIGNPRESRIAVEILKERLLINES